MKKLIKKQISSQEFDELFESGDVSDYLDKTSIKIHYPTQRITIDFTKDMLAQIDNEASRIGVTRTSLIKVWIFERLTESHA